MTTNIKSKSVAGSGVAVATSATSRIIAVNAYSPDAGTIDITDKNGSVIKFQVPASGQIDTYIGELGVKCEATISVSAPGAGLITIFLG
jgi:hypothetical protein